MKFSLIVLPMFLVSICQAAKMEAPFDKLELRDLSQLRVQVRNVEKPEQCVLFWRGISEKVSGGSGQFESTADGLNKLAKALKEVPSFLKMADYVEECVKSLSHDGQIAAEPEKLSEPNPADKLNEYEEELSLNKAELEQKATDIESALRKNMELQSELDKRVKECEENVEKIKQLNEEKEAALEQVEDLKVELEELKRVEVALREEKEKFAKSYAKLLSSVNENLNEHKNEIVGLKEKLDEANETLNDNKNEIEGLKEKLDKAVSKEAGYAKEVKDLTAQKTNLNQKVKDLERHTTPKPTCQQNTCRRTCYNQWGQLVWC